MGVVFLLLGAFVGAGFVSGREIYVFFARFGIYGYIGLIISCCVMTLNICFEFKVINQSQGVKIIKGGGRIEWLNKLIGVVYYSCCLIVFVAMLAGIYELFGLFHNALLNVFTPAIIIIICIILSAKSVKYLKIINIMLIILTFITIIAILNSCKINQWPLLVYNYQSINIDNVGLLLKAILYGLFYAGMNSLSVLPVIKLVVKDKVKHKTGLLIAVYFSLIAGLIMLFECVILMRRNLNIGIAMPILTIAEGLGEFIYILYFILIIMGLLTTLVSSAKVLIYVFKKDDGHISFYLICLLYGGGLVLSLIGFGVITRVLYPVIGVIGIVLITVRNINFALIKKRN